MYELSPVYKNVIQEINENRNNASGHQDRLAVLKVLIFGMRYKA